MNTRSVAADLFFPSLVVGVIGMMIFPLPAGLLDCLIVVNITISLLLLLSALFFAEPERFTVLPSLLLITTLFRLALNISTTRQILVYGEAPSTVTAFGNFVIGGEYVVGAVLFLIISIVQFLVIAKGAERVAEVAARFTLDAMPGRQMAIDADVRAGVINLIDAREQRLELQRESKLYGALDGAMKFIKGDAIAGLLIIAINGGAGIVLGVFSHGLTAVEAFYKYTLFTIGDGLVSQLPALLVSVAAGVTVTRVSQGEGQSFGRELFEQIGSDFRTELIAGGFLLLLSLAPGLPALPLLGCGAILLCLSRRRQQQASRRVAEASQPGFAPKLYGPVHIKISVGIVNSLRVEGQLINKINQLRNEIFDLIGVVVPEPRFDIDYSQAECAAELYLNGIEAGRFTATDSALTGPFVSWLRKQLHPQILTLIDDSHTRTLLSLHRAGNEELIGALIPTVTGITALTALSRQLLAEGVSIRSFPVVLQAVADHYLITQEGSVGRAAWPSERIAEADTPGRTKSFAMTAFVRAALRREITRMACRGQSWISALKLTPEIDDLLAALGRVGSVLDPEIGAAIIRRAQEHTNEENRVILASNFARPILAELLLGGTGNPDIRWIVIAPEEIEAGVPIRIVGEFSLDTLVAREEETEDYSSNYVPEFEQVAQL